MHIIFFKCNMRQNIRKMAKYVNQSNWVRRQRLIQDWSRVVNTICNLSDADYASFKSFRLSNIQDDSQQQLIRKHIGDLGDILQWLDDALKVCNENHLIPKECSLQKRSFKDHKDAWQRHINLEKNLEAVYGLSKECESLDVEVANSLKSFDEMDEGYYSSYSDYSESTYDSYTSEDEEECDSKEATPHVDSTEEAGRKNRRTSRRRR